MFSRSGLAAASWLLLVLAPAGRADAPRLDGDGEPLPKGALARLGTLRFRHPGPVTALAYTRDGLEDFAVSCLLSGAGAA